MINNMEKNFLKYKKYKKKYYNLLQQLGAFNQNYWEEIHKWENFHKIEYKLLDNLLPYELNGSQKLIDRFVLVFPFINNIVEYKNSVSYFTFTPYLKQIFANWKNSIVNINDQLFMINKASDKETENYKKWIELIKITNNKEYLNYKELSTKLINCIEKSKSEDNKGKLSIINIGGATWYNLIKIYKYLCDIPSDILNYPIDKNNSETFNNKLEIIFYSRNQILESYLSGWNKMNIDEFRNVNNLLKLRSLNILLEAWIRI